jgi:MFS family permease
MQQLSPSSDVPPATPSPGGAPVGAYLVAFVMLGIQASFAGPALSHLRDRMHTDDGGIAWVFVGAAVGYIAGSMLSGRGVDGGKGHSRWVLCMALSTAAVGLVAVVPNLGLLSIAATRW